MSIEGAPLSGWIVAAVGPHESNDYYSQTAGLATTDAAGRYRLPLDFDAGYCFELSVRIHAHAPGFTTPSGQEWQDLRQRGFDDPLYVDATGQLIARVQPALPRWAYWLHRYAGGRPDHEVVVHDCNGGVFDGLDFRYAPVPP